MGLQGGMLSEKFDGSKVDAGESGDPAFATSDVRWKRNGFGLRSLLSFTDLGMWDFQRSILLLLRSNLGESNEFKIDATYYLTGGYNIQLRNPFLTIKSSALVKYDGTAWRGDVTGRLVYQHERTHVVWWSDLQSGHIL